MLLLRLPVAVAALVLGALPVALALGLLALGVEGLGGDSERFVGPWALGIPVGLLLCLLALPAAIVAIAIHEGIGRLLRRLAQALLRSETAGEGPVREMLAERLGDRSLNIAYWLPDREIFVDDRGRQVTLPGAGSGRAWTAVEREGTRVAAIVHDAELDATPELVHAAASAAVLALDNERLKADLRARAGGAAPLAPPHRRSGRRRPPPDRAQPARRRAAAARLARARPPAPARPAQGQPGGGGDRRGADRQAQRRARRAARAGARHPPGGAVRPRARAGDPRAGRACLDPGRVRSRVRRPAVAAGRGGGLLRGGRGPHQRRQVRQRDKRPRERPAPRRPLEVEVADDGIGGAQIDAGSGLRGLSDRLAALEGELMVDSPLGEGTRLGARIPARGEE